MRAWTRTSLSAFGDRIGLRGFLSIQSHRNYETSECISVFLSRSLDCLIIGLRNRVVSPHPIPIQSTSILILNGIHRCRRDTRGLGTPVLFAECYPFVSVFFYNSNVSITLPNHLAIHLN